MPAVPTAPGAGTAATANDLVERTRGLLLSGQPAVVDRLAVPCLASAVSLELMYADAGAGIDRGTVVSVDLEDIRIWEWDAGSKTATNVERGVNGTVAADHADLAVVELGSKFSRFRILQAINDDLADLSSPANGLFRAATLTFTYDAGVVGYDLAGATDALDVLSVTHNVPGSNALAWPDVPPNMWRVARDMDPTVFPSGFAFFLTGGGYTGATYRVTYKAQFGMLGDLDDDVQAATGLPATANDLPPMGAAINLVFPREVKRNFTEGQGDSRRAEEVPAGATTGSVSGLRTRRRERIGAERATLTAKYPDYLDLPA